MSNTVPKASTVSRKVPIDGARLHEKVTGWGKVENFCKDVRISKSAYYAAVKTGLINKYDLKRASDLLSLPTSFFISSHGSVSEADQPITLFDLSGSWTNLLLEQAYRTESTWKQESLEITQNGHMVSGVFVDNDFEILDTTERRSSFIMSGSITGTCLSGQFHSPEREPPHGMGMFQLVIRSNTWCDGFCTYFGANGAIGCSENIMIKKSAADYHLILEHAKREMKNRGRYWDNDR